MEEIFNKKIEIDTYILIGEINNFDLIDNLIKDVREGVKISKVSGKTNVKGEHTEFNYLVANPIFHKFLKIIQPSIYKIYQENFLIKEVWGNIYSKNGDYALSHTHDDSAFCGILYCTDGPGPGTYFSQYDLLIKEKKGRFILFHPKLLHEVTHYDYKNDRITIAWNFSATKKWIDYDNVYFIGKDKKIIL
jgi:hypothetical protein